MMKVDPQQATDFQLAHEFRELLEQICSAADATFADELDSSVIVLLQLLDLLESGRQEDAYGTHSEDLNAFLQTAFDAIRNSLEHEDASQDCLHTLRQQALDQWPEFFSGTDATKSSHCDDEAWQDLTSPDHEEAGPEAEVLQPASDQQISELLAQLGQAAASAPAPARKANPASTAAAGPKDSAVLNDVAFDEADLDDEVREAFLDDAGRCMRAMEGALLAFEAHPDDRAPLQQICRELHTLKGASGSVGMFNLAEDLHQFEDLLRDSQSANFHIPDVASLFTRLDAVRQQVDRVAAAPVERSEQSGDGDAAVVGPAGGASASALASTFVEAAGDDQSVRVKASQLNRLMDMLAELVMLRNRRHSELSELKGIHSDLLLSVSRLRSIGDADAEAGIARGQHGRPSPPEDAVPRLAQVAGDILESAHRLRDCYQPVAEGNAAVSQFIRQFRQELVELRRMPVAGLFRRLQRVASDAARAERKQVRMHMIGEDAGIERSLQERLYEPLLHIVRNAVSHGIEEGDERTRHGKDPHGTVTLEARTGADLLTLEIRDDGRGLDYDALRRRGIERGLLQHDKAATRDELAMLIFHPGFSTQQSASQISGRGVGMDVVASTIARMRGWVEVDSTPGHGTTIRLSFPLPSVIQHTMVVRATGQLFALPMQFVQEAGGEVADIHAVDLGCLFNPSSAPANPTTAGQLLVLDCESSMGSDSRRLVLSVDEIVGPEEVVVRPLPSLLKHHPLCSGATLSGMGEVVLVLDHRRLSSLAAKQNRNLPIGTASE